MNVDIGKIEATLEDLKKTLRDGLIASAIWDRATGLSLADYNPQPAAVALFTQVTEELTDVLSGAGYPVLRQYYFVDLAGGNAAMVILHGSDILQGILLDVRKANIGVLLAVVLPKMIDSVQKARN